MTTRWALSLLLIGGVTSFNDDTVMIQSRIQAKVSDRPLPATAIGSPEHCQESVVKEEPDESPLDEDVPHFDFEDLDFDSEMDAMAVAEEDAKQKVPQVRKFYDGEESYNSEVFYEVTRADPEVIEATRESACASLYEFLTDQTTTPGHVTRASVLALYAEDETGTGELQIFMNDLLYDDVDDFWAIFDTADGDPVAMGPFCDGLIRASARLMDPVVLQTLKDAKRLEEEVNKETGCGKGPDLHFCIGMKFISDPDCEDSDSSPDYCTASQLYSLSAYSSDCDIDINVAQMITVAEEGRRAMASLDPGTHNWKLAVKTQNNIEVNLQKGRETCEQSFNLKMNGLEIDMAAFEESILQEKGVDWQWRYQQRVISKENEVLAVAVSVASEQKFLATADKVTCLGVLVEVGTDADQESLPVPSCLMEEEDGTDSNLTLRSKAVIDFLADYSLGVQLGISGEIVVASLNVAALREEMDTQIDKYLITIKKDGEDVINHLADGMQLMKLQGHPDAHFGAKKDRKVIAPPNAFEREHLAKQGAELAKSTTKKAESGDPDVAEDIPEVEVEAPEEPEPRPVDFVPTAAELLESQQACVNQLTAEDCHSRTNCDWTNGCSEKSQ